MRKHDSQERSRGFTLLELIIVIAILAILAVVITLALNPAESLARARDSQRLSDLRALKTAINLYIVEAPSPDLDGILNNCDSGIISPNASIFVSGDGKSGNDITDISFSGKGTPEVSIDNQDRRDINGTGWIPVNFTAAGSALPALPLDPGFSVADLGNITINDHLYLYGCGENPLAFELNANMESARFSRGSTTDDKESTDGGNNPDIYETGTDLTLIGGAFVLDLQVGASADDAREIESTGNMSIDTIIPQMQANTTASFRYWIGLRWTGIPIPQGSTIDVAYLEVNVNTTSYDDANGNLHFQLAPASSGFTTTPYDITNRPRTIASTSWIADGLGTGWVQSPSLVIPLQEVVDNYSPTALVLIGRPNTDLNKNLRTNSYDGGAGFGAKLHIEYTVP